MMKSLLRVFVVSLVALAAVLALYFRQTDKPKCNCFYPNSGKYGVLSSGGGCVVTECVPEKPKAQASDSPAGRASAR